MNPQWLGELDSGSHGRLVIKARNPSSLTRDVTDSRRQAGKVAFTSGQVTYPLGFSFSPL